MTNLFDLSDRHPKSTNLPKVRITLVFLLLGLSSNAVMWGLALSYLKFKSPVYSSSWTLSLPGNVTNTKLNLPNSGTASEEAVSPYANVSQDPREIYRFIATSEPVLRAAATQIKLSSGEFGQPRIKIVENTTLMNFEIIGKSSEQAQKKAWAFYNAFQVRLNELRAQEVAQREEKIKKTLGSAQQKLEVTQKRLSDYQVHSGLASTTQIEQLSATIEELRKRRAEAVTQQQQSSARLKQLSANLDVTAQQAADAFVLKNDQLFQQYLKDYSASTANLVVLSSKFLPNHPAIIEEQSKLNSVKTALLARSVSLLGHPANAATLAQLNLGSSDQTSSRENLFKELVASQLDQQGFKVSAQELDKQLAELEAKRKTLIQSGSILEALKRDQQIAEAVFSSTLASSDIGKSALFGSYPEVQLLTEPSLPDSPVSPNKKLVLLGAASGSLLTTTGLGLLFLYKRREIKLAHKTLNGTKQIAKL